MEPVSIIIVEDEAVTAMFMEIKLRRIGYNVLKCIPTGEEAILFAAERKADFIIMDIRLAGKMDGIEAAELIKDVNDCNSRFIFTTGYSDTECRERALRLDPAGFLIKPVNVAELTGIIELNCNTQKHPLADSGKNEKVFPVKG
jgi:response regulator RpfG family c-di-GMP phosphodiesterase